MLAAKKTKGFTLTELLISLSISMMVIAGLISVFYSIMKHSRLNLEVTRLDRELSSAVNIMAKDIQRAGYWGAATTSNSNPFMVAGSTDITVNGSNSCLLLTYDQDGDGTLPGVGTGTDDERYGYRLMNGAIQYRPSGASFSCSAGSNAWQNLTDPKTITITSLTFTLNNEAVDIDGTGSGTATTNIRTVDIAVTGQLVSDSTVTKTITRTVRVYNDKYSP